MTWKLDLCDFSTSNTYLSVFPVVFLSRLLDQPLKWTLTPSSRTDCTVQQFQTPKESIASASVPALQRAILLNVLKALNEYLSSIRNIF